MATSSWCLLPKDDWDSVSTLNSTPDRYIQVRSRNGSSWLKSFTVEPSRATNRPTPTLKNVCSSSAGMASSQNQVIGSPLIKMMTTSTSMDRNICCSSMITYASGRAARGNCRARISGRLSVITVEVEMNARWVKLNTNTPTTRNEMKSGMPLDVFRITPKISQ